MAISKEQPLRPYVQALGDNVDALDDAVLSGDIVSAGAVQAFDTVADMQAATYLEAGMVCHTNGFHAAGDGGAAYYTVSASGTANGMDVLALQGGLVATLVLCGNIALQQLGAVSYDASNPSDTRGIITRAAELSNDVTGLSAQFYATRFDITGVSLHDVSFVLPSQTTHEYACIFTNCDIDSCTFQSFNDKEPSWDGSTVLQSNVLVVVNNTDVRNCTFKTLEGLQISNGAGIVVSNCTFDECFTAIIVASVDGATIENVFINGVAEANNKHHGIYLSKNTSNITIKNVHIADVKYFPLHFYNSNTGSENPSNIVAEDIYITGSVADGIACNGSVKFRNISFDQKVTDRYFFGYGTYEFSNCDINTTLLLSYADSTQPFNVTFDQCTFSVSYLVVATGSMPTVSSLVLTIRNSIINGKFSVSQGKKISYYSFGNRYINTSKLFDNAGFSSADALSLYALFSGDYFYEPTNDIIYCYGCTFEFMDCYFHTDTVNTLVANRGGAQTVINASNVTFSKSGEHIISNSGLAGFLNNVYNET